MALADTPYITVPWTAPASDLTDYVGYYDLSDAPQSWWDEVDTSDGTKLRVAKDDAPDNDTSATELAFEIVDLDTVNQTGQLWFRWSGTLPATSPDDVRIYASQDSYTSYGVTDTFGRNAVWVNHTAVYHLNNDPSGTAPQIIDVTGNGNDGTTAGVMTSDDLISGKIGQALALDANDGINVDGIGTTGSGNRMVQMWLRTSTTSESPLYNEGTRDGVGTKWALTCDNGDLRVRVISGSASWSGTLNSGNWEKLDVGLDGSTPDNMVVYQNGAALNQGDSSSTTIDTDTTAEIHGDDEIQDNTFPTDFDEVRKLSSVLSSDYIALEYANQNDPATFWGTPTFVAAGGGTTEVSFSLNSAANVSSSSTSIAEAGISLNADAEVSDGSTATGESDLSISHIQQASTQSTAQAESSFSLASLLQIAFDKQSITDASFSLPTVHQVTTVSDTQETSEASFSLALQKAITTEQISTIEVSYSLNAAHQAAMSSDATGEATMSLTLQASLSLVSTALAEAGISFNAVQSLTLSGQAVGVEVTLSDGRTLTIKLQNRTFSIASENRTFTIDDDNRTLNIDP